MNISFLTTTSLLQLVCIIMVIWVVMKLLEYRNMPPGPFGLPFVGYYPFLRTKSYEVLHELKKKYGDIISVKIGTNTHIIISDCDMAKELLNNPLTFARPPTGAEVFPGKGGVSFAGGKEWTEQRRFSVATLKSLGLGRGEWEKKIVEEVNEFISEISQYEGKATSIFRSLECSVAGNIFSLLTGETLPKDPKNSDFKILMKFIDEVLIHLNPTNLSGNMPVFFLKIAKIYPMGPLRSIMESVMEFEKLLERKIVKRNSNEESSFISYYLQELNKQNENQKKFSTSNLAGNIMTLFIGGFDTNLASISWLFMIMASNENVQQKIHQEIDDVVGKDRQIFWEDHKFLTYVMATIYEMERWASVVPLFPPRWNTVPIEIKKYTIPKNCFLVTNMWSIARNEKHFKNPDIFEPERFISSEKQLLKNTEFMPFSFGKRNCPGEHVALMTIFLYFTSIMQNFKITCPKDKQIKLENKGNRVVRHPIYQELCFIKR